MPFRPEKLIGKRVGCFQVTRLVSCCDRSIVFYGFGTIPVAIKISGLDGPDAIEKELEVYRLLAGTRIALPVLWSGTIADRKAFVIPRLEFRGSGGSDLQHILFYTGTIWSPACVEQFARSALICLRVLHEHGIIHGDIKPSNFLFDEAHGRLYLIDFEAFGRFNKDCYASAVTALYASPAALRYEVIGPRDDLIALCRMLHYFLTGESFPVRLFVDSLSDTGELWDAITPWYAQLLDVSLPTLFHGQSAALSRFIKRILELKTHEMPDYNELEQILDSVPSLNLSSGRVAASVTPKVYRNPNTGPSIKANISRAPRAYHGELSRVLGGFKCAT